MYTHQFDLDPAVGQIAKIGVVHIAGSEIIYDRLDADGTRLNPHVASNAPRSDEGFFPDLATAEADIITHITGESPAE